MAGRSGSFSVDDPFRTLADRMSLDQPGPHGGSAAALTTAMAASLALLATRLTDGLQIEALEAETLRERAEQLAVRDAEAYADYLHARADKHDAPLGEALARAAETPLEIAETAASVATLAASLAERGSPTVQGDAVAAALLAEAAARASANLVAVNLTVRAGDERIERAKAAVAAATTAAEQAWRLAREMP
jgi:formiminotetrahydrofolate cyclodeaminase